MSRVIDLVILLVIIMLIVVMQGTAAGILTPIKNEMKPHLEDGNDNVAEDKTNVDDQYIAVVKWVPMVALMGSIVIVLFREYRRQRVTRGGLR